FLFSDLRSDFPSVCRYIYIPVADDNKFPEADFVVFFVSQIKPMVCFTLHHLSSSFGLIISILSLGYI
ncbi:unnamed protein product, partial [Brassica rapa]